MVTVLMIRVFTAALKHWKNSLVKHAERCLMLLTMSETAQATGKINETRRQKRLARIGDEGEAGLWQQCPSVENTV